FPGATRTSTPERARCHARACSRPPDPTTRTFTRFCADCTSGPDRVGAMHTARFLLIVLLGLWLLVPASASAQSAPTINMNSDTFDQPQLVISAGDTVTWNNPDGDVHTVTADDGSFDSGDVGGS